MINTSLLELELQPGSPGGFIPLKLPRTNIDHQDLLVQRRVAVKQGGTLTLGGPYFWDLALLLEGLSAENATPLSIGTINLMLLSGRVETCPMFCAIQLKFGMTPKALFEF